MPAPLETVLQDALGSHYRLERELEAGGMSRLFLATDVRLKREVVVKVLPPDLVSEASAARFKREIELTVRLQHPHILPILTSGEFEDGLYYITPYIQGESLRARIERDGKLPLDDILRILKDVSGALAFAHQRGIVHRDIKPGNILLSDGQAILADFGIARAVSTTATPLTDSGVAPGTPAYMAPELPTDERADVYALGVVAYEMLCGALPGTAVTVRAVMTRRGRISRDRGGRVRAVARLVVDSIAPSPEKRLVSVREFRSRLDQRGISRQLKIVSGTILAVSIVSAAVGHRLLSLATSLRLERDAYVILPGAEAGWADFNSDVGRIRAAAAEWADVRVSDVDLDSGPAKSPRRSLTRGEAVDYARRVRAGNLILVATEAQAGHRLLRATLFDAATDSVVNSQVVPITGPISTDQARVLLNGVLRGRGTVTVPWVRSNDHRPHRLAAWRTFDDGMVALTRWDLLAAEAAFRRAIEIEPDHALANLSLAEVLTWSEAPGTDAERRRSAAHAVQLVDMLSRRDAVRSVAVLAMADSDFAGACRAYQRLVALDSTSFFAWVGLGECNRRDRLVVRDAASTSGWAFRGSHEQAIRAFQRAGDLVPPGADSAFRGWQIGRLTRVLYTRSEKRRLGYAVRGADTLQFVASPRLVDDTLSFTPRRLRDPVPARSPALIAQEIKAVRQSRALLRGVAEQWATRSPNAAAAYDSLASLTEAADGTATVGGRSMTALDVLERALSLARDSTERLRLAISEARILLKNGQFSRASRLADSILRRDSGAHPGFDGMAGLAAIAGRRNVAARLAGLGAARFHPNTPDGVFLSLPVQLSEMSLSLLAFAALGGPMDSVSAIADRLSRTVSSYYSNPAEAATIRGVLVAPALTLSFPALSERLESLRAYPDEYVRAELAVVHGDPASANGIRRATRERLIGDLPGTMAADQTLRQVNLSLALGDTATAIQQLDAVLLALPSLGAHLLSQLEQVASLIRAMGLRADIADRSNDHATARVWASAVAQLWSSPDAGLEPFVERMRGIAAR